MIENALAQSRVLFQKKRQFGTLTYQDLLDAHKFFNEKCPYCESPIDGSNLHLEHIIPISMGGTTDAWNCIPICDRCNLSKRSMHLLDWWDKNYTVKDEYKLAKIFEYIVGALNKDRIIKISTKEETENLNLLIQDDEGEENNVNYFDQTLDTFTFMYQLLNHLKENKQIDQEKIDEYQNVLHYVYNKNSNLKKLDYNEYKIQTDLVKYLKKIYVNDHYLIAFNYSRKINDISWVEKNVERIREYLHIKNNLGYIINSNPELLVIDAEKIKDSYKYLVDIIGINREAILKKTNMLNDIELAKKFYNKCQEVGFDVSKITDHAFARGNLQKFYDMLASEEYKENPSLFTTQTLAHGNLKDIREMLASKEYKENPRLFTSQVLAYGNLKEIREMLASEEYKQNPSLFTSQTLVRGNLKKIREMLASKEYKQNKELFTSSTLVRGNLSEIREMLASEEYEQNKELFTATTLAHGNLKEIREMLASEEYKQNKELFTSTTLAQGNLKEIREMLASKEYKQNKELFTSSTLARGNFKKIREILASKEYKENPRLFTSETLIHGNLKEIQEILASEEYKQNPNLFKSSTLARGNLKEIREILNMEQWKDARYSKLLTSSILSKKKSSIILNIKLAEHFEISSFINIKYLFHSPSQNYALISLLNDININLVINNKLNCIFGYQPGVLDKKYGINLNKLIEKYPLNPNLIIGEKNAIR